MPITRQSPTPSPPTKSTLLRATWPAVTIGKMSPRSINAPYHSAVPAAKQQRVSRALADELFALTWNRRALNIGSHRSSAFTP